MQDTVPITPREKSGRLFFPLQSLDLLAVPSRWKLRSFALSVIFLVTLLRLAYLYFDCPLDLSPDEAHYWHWSQHLDWSYYSKGPAVAWLIRASCELLGDTMFAVRVPAVVCGMLTLVGLYLLTLCIYRNEQYTLGVVLLSLTLPVLHAGSLLMTIDAPYVCAWTWALVVAHRIVAQPRSGLGSWVLLGLIIGLGILAKYTMALFIPSLGLFLLTSRRHRPMLRQPGFWLMGLTTAICCLPILIWNAQHDWVTFAHVGRQAGVSNGPRWSPFGPLEYIGGQAALLLGVWFIVYVWSVVRCSRLLTPDSWFLWCLSVPMFLTFLLFSLKTKVELNWPITAYLSGMVLAVGLVGELWNHRWWRRAFLTTAIVGTIGTVLLLHSEWLYPLAARVDPSLNIRRYDPTCRLKGWQALAAEVDALRHELKDEEPLIAASTWSYPGALFFYCDGHPETYNFALAVGGRHSQYDFWRPNPIHDPDAFRGRTFIYVGEVTAEIRAAFEQVGETRLVVHEIHSLRVAVWQVTICRGFKGFARVAGTGY